METTIGRSRARWRLLALIGVFSLVLVQLVLAAGPAPAQVAGDELYAADGAGGNPTTTLYKVNPATGAKTVTLGPIGFQVTGLAFDPTTGILYGSTTSQDPNEPGSLIRINVATGAGTLVGAAGTRIITGCDTGTADITFTTDGTLYGWTECTDDLVQINKATGVGTTIGTGTGSAGSGLSADPDNNTLWLTPDNDDGDYGTVDKTTGVFTSQGTLDGDNGNSINSLAWSCDGETLYGTANIQSGGGDREFITINTATDHITVLGGSNLVDPEQDALAWKCAAPPPPPQRCKGKAPTITGTTGNDVLTGTSGRDIVLARSGNDRISTLGGNDLVCAGGGRDKANGGGGKDRLLGQAGNDRLKGAGGNDVLRGGGGTDRCNGGPGTDTGNCEREISIP
jgi:Ca2+-binding RTX toxin-like protein